MYALHALRRHAGLIAIASVALVLIFVPTPAAAGIFSSIGEILASFIQWIIQLLGKLLLFITDVFLLPIAQYNGFLDSPAVNAGWQVVRDLTNMFFVVMMLVIAFGTILSIEEFSYHALLPRLLIMAVLINFSKVIAGLFIDFSQVVMLTFVNGFAAAAGANMLNLLQVKNIFQVSVGATDALGSGDILGSLFLGLAMIGIGLVIVVIMTGMLAMRIVMLWALLILSPIAFFLSSFPRGRAKEAYSKWWSMFGNYLTAGPVLAFFLWIAFYTAGSGTLSKTEGFPTSVVPEQERGTIEDITEKGVGKQFFASEAGSEASMVSFIIGIALLMAGMMITQEFSVMGGSAMSGAANWMQSRGGAFLKGTAAAPARMAWTGVKWGERKVAKLTGVGLNPVRYIEGFKAARETQKKKDEAAIRARAYQASQVGGVFAPVKVFASNPEDFFRNYFSLRGIGLAARTITAPRSVKHYMDKAQEQQLVAQEFEESAARYEKEEFTDEEILEKRKELAKKQKKPLDQVGHVEALDALTAQAPELARRNKEEAQNAKIRAADLVKQAQRSRAPVAVMGAAAERALEAEARKEMPEHGQKSEDQIIAVKDALERRDKAAFKVIFKRMMEDGNIDDIMIDLKMPTNLEGAKQLKEKILQEKFGMNEVESMEYLAEIDQATMGKRSAFSGLTQRDAKTGGVRWASEDEYVAEWIKQSSNFGNKRLYSQGNRHMFGYDAPEGEGGKFHAHTAGALSILNSVGEFKLRMGEGRDMKGKLRKELLSAKDEFIAEFQKLQDLGLASADTVREASEAFEKAEKTMGGSAEISNTEIARRIRESSTKKP